MKRVLELAITLVMLFIYSGHVHAQQDEPIIGYSIKTFNSLYTNKDYRRALEVGSVLLKEEEKSLGANHSVVIDLIQKMADCSFHTKQYDEAVKFEEIAKKRIEKKGKGTNLYSKSISNLAKYYNALNDSVKTISYATEVVNGWQIRISLPWYSGYEDGYRLSLIVLANYYARYGNKDEAIKYQTIALDYVGKELGYNHVLYGDTYYKIGQYYYELKDYKASIEYDRTGLDVFGTPSNDNSVLYFATCYSMINAYQKLGMNDEAFALAKKAVDSYTGNGSEIYGFVVHELASMYEKRGDINSVIEYGQKALDAFGAPSSSNSVLYFATCNSMINVYQKLGKNSEAFALAKKAVDSYTGKGSEICGFVVVVHQLASMYEKRGDIISAIKLNQKAFDALSSPKIGNSGLYFGICSSLIKAFQKMGRYEEAIECANKAEQILPRIKNKSYAMIFEIISELYFHLEDWHSTIKYGMKALDGFGEGNADDPDSHYSTYNQISNAYLHLGDKVKSMRYAEEALNYVEQFQD